MSDGFKFGTVGVIEPKASSSKKTDRTEIGAENILLLAALDVISQTITVVRKDTETDIKAAAKLYFITNGCATKTQPDNYTAIENKASASSELRKRSSASKLSDDDIRLCKEEGIPTEEVVEVLAAFVINPAYLPAQIAEGQDEAEYKAAEKAKARVMSNMEALLRDAIKSGKLPADIIKEQKGSTYTILAKNALDVLFTKPLAVVEKLFSVCGTQAVGKTKFPGTVAEALVIVGKIIPVFAAKAEAAKAAGKSKKSSEKAAA